MFKRLVKRLFPQKHKFKLGELVQHMDCRTVGGLPVYEVEYLYYDLNFQPVTIVRAAAGGPGIISIDENVFMRYNGIVNTNEVNFGS